MKLLEFFQFYQKTLEENYPGINIVRLQRELEENNYQLKEFQNKLLQGIPLEYISNNSFFYKYNFYVNENVLIPRSETEILVEKALEIIHEHKLSNIYEVGLGSGCISLSIALESKVALNIEASDICEKALDIALKNLKKYEEKVKEHKLNFVNANLFRKDDSSLYDMIVSNPPYIKKHSDKNGVHKQVDSFEPTTALYLEDEKYDDWFDHLFSKSSKKLEKDGFFLMEGHEDHLQALEKISKKYFRETQVIQDYTQRDRFLLTRGIKNG